MRRLMVVGLLAVVALAGCALIQGGLALGSVPWNDGDSITYDLLDNNDVKVGTTEFRFSRQGETWLLGQTDKTNDLEQVFTVTVKADSLRPLGEQKTIKASGTDISVVVNYSDSKVEIQATVNGENRRALIDNSQVSLDNDQVLSTLRALNFAEGYEGKFTTVVPQEALRILSTVRVSGKEQVDTPAGKVAAWRVELEFGQTRQLAWYEVELPHRLVQYDNGAVKMVLSR